MRRKAFEKRGFWCIISCMGNSKISNDDNLIFIFFIRNLVNPFSLISLKISNDKNLERIHTKRTPSFEEPLNEQGKKLPSLSKAEKDLISSYVEEIKKCEQIKWINWMDDFPRMFADKLREVYGILNPMNFTNSHLKIEFGWLNQYMNIREMANGFLPYMSPIAEFNQASDYIKYDYGSSDQLSLILATKSYYNILNNKLQYEKLKEINSVDDFSTLSSRNSIEFAHINIENIGFSTICVLQLSTFMESFLRNMCREVYILSYGYSKNKIRSLDNEFNDLCIAQKFDMLNEMIDQKRPKGKLIILPDISSMRGVVSEFINCIYKKRNSIIHELSDYDGSITDLMSMRGIDYQMKQRFDITLEIANDIWKNLRNLDTNCFCDIKPKYLFELSKEKLLGHAAHWNLVSKKLDAIVNNKNQREGVIGLEKKWSFLEQ